MSRRTPLWVLAVALALAAPTASQAHLGGALASVAVDRARLGATGSDTPAAAGLRHVLSLGEAGELHEYSDAQGRVFAVSWDTVGRPDLRQLLGPELFVAYQRRATSEPGRRGRRLLTMGGRSDDLVVQASGRPGAFAGFAYIPSLLPAGFTAAQLR